MSLTGALNAAVTGLNAQSSALAMIATNLSNSSTVGYKSITASFATMLNGSSSSKGAVGGVTVKGLTDVGAQGLPMPSTVSTHMFVNGSGFFVTAPETGSNSFSYTRNGEFMPNDQGYLVNTANGQYLQGWPTDSEGNLLTGNNAASLEAVDINKYPTIADATTKAALTANLPSEAGNPPTAPAPIVGAVFPADVDTTAGAKSFTVNGVTVTLPMGAGAAGLWTAAEVATEINNALTTAGITTLSASEAGGALTFTNTATGTASNISITGFTGGLTAAAMGLTTTTSTGTGAAPGSFTSSMTVYDSLGTTAEVKMTWTKTAQNTWTVTFANPTMPGGGAVVGTTTSAPITLSFNGDGTLASSTPNTPSLEIAWTTGALDSAGSPSATSSGAIALDFAGMSQNASGLAADKLVVELENSVDGAEFGKLKSVSVGANGTVYALYSNDMIRALYKVPVATFANANGLTQASGGLYAQSGESGDATLRVAGQNGASDIQGATLEMSTTDTNKEFANMMTAQQAYSGSAQVMTAANDMFDTLIGAVR